MINNFILFSDVNGYPQINKLCKPEEDHIITIAQVPGLQLTIPKQCLTNDVSVTLTVHYWDSPYRNGLQSKDDDTHLINLSPIVRLEPDGYRFEDQQSSKVKLQLPIPFANQLYQHFNINDIRELNLQLAHRSQSDDEWQMKNIKDQPDISIKKINDICCISIPIDHFSDRVLTVETITSTKLNCSQSYQQEIAVVAYLSPIDSVRKMVNLTLYLIRSDICNAKKENFATKYCEHKTLSCQGLEDVVLKNGLYKLKFDPWGLSLRHDEFLEQHLIIDWNKNKKGYYQYYFNCNIQLSVDELQEVANFVIKPTNNQSYQNPISFTLKMVRKFPIRDNCRCFISLGLL